MDTLVMLFAKAGEPVWMLSNMLGDAVWVPVFFLLFFLLKSDGHKPHQQTEAA